MGKVAEPPFPEKGSNPWIPSGPSPPTTHRPISQKQIGGEGGANRAKCAQGCGSDSDDNQDGVTDPLYNVDSQQQVTRGQGTPDITTNQPEQMLWSQVPDLRTPNTLPSSYHTVS